MSHRGSITSAFLLFSMGLLPHCLLGQGRMLPFRDTSLAVETRVNDLRSRLSLDEKASLFSGQDMWHFKGISRLGIPPIQMTDCGHGITVVLDSAGNYTGCATCFPTAVGQAASWNRGLLQEIGAALGQEARATGSSLLLAPMVNIHRSPLGGRNYESFSEDPLLSGKLAAAFIQGVQSAGVGACVKAIVANNQQTDQSGLMVNVSEKALREIYMRTFQIPVMEADPWAVMTAYNGVNGFPCAENKHLNVDILRNEWQYNGLVISDWRSVRSIASFEGGVDMEMPGPGKHMRREDIQHALKNRELSQADLDRRLEGLLRLWINVGAVDGARREQTKVLNADFHRQLARKAAQESIVLLKNAGGLLPLQKSKIKKLAIIGPNASEARLGGGGSASVTACYSVSPLEGIGNFCGDSVEVGFEQGCGLTGNVAAVPADYLSHGAGLPGLKVAYFNNQTLSGEPVASATDDIVDFSWGWAAPSPGIDKGNYSVRWTGTLSPPVSGDYKLGLAIFGSGARLYLNEKLLIDAWGTGEPENYENAFARSRKWVKLPLKAETVYQIRIEWHKKINRNMIRLEWEIPGRSAGIERAVQLAREADVAIVFAGLSNFFEGGNHDRASLALPGDQDSLIRRVCAANPHTIVVLINGSPVAMPWIDQAASVVEAYYSGQEGGNAIADIIFGKVNPSGKLPETFPIRLRDNPSFGHFPGRGKTVDYREGTLVGYRHYDAKDITPLFPFGHGLSYTRFSYSGLKILTSDSVVHVRFNLTNAGKRAGKEVVQLYVGRHGTRSVAGLKELKDFAKIELAPGRSAAVSFDLPRDAFAEYDTERHAWLIKKGHYDVQLGSSSRDIRLRGNVVMR